MSKNSGIVEIHGREYETVALRVKKFRTAYPNYTLQTQIVSRDDECVVMQASISDEQGRLIATGHSEEYRHTSQINRTSALENAETSAIGRALAAFGLGGTEFATADEVANAIQQQGKRGRITPAGGSLERLSPEDQLKARQVANSIVDLWGEGKEFAAYEAFYRSGHEQEFLYGVWELLGPHSSMRNKLKAMDKDEDSKPKKAA